MKGSLCFPDPLASYVCCGGRFSPSHDGLCPNPACCCHGRVRENLDAAAQALFEACWDGDVDPFAEGVTA